MNRVYVAQACMIILYSINTVYGDNLLASLGFQTELQKAMTTSFIIYCLGLIIFFAFVTIIFYRFVKYEEAVRQFQMKSSSESIRLMHSIRTQMISLKLKRTLALLEAAKKVLHLKKTSQKKIEAIEAERSPMSTQLLNRQQSIRPPLSTHKKLVVSKSIMPIATYSKKQQMKSITDDTQICQ